jgi:predicted O-linked N-acetylglucosamine transferase (SPINDLY family)
MPGNDSDQAFERALQHHQSGRLPEAEQGYRKILERDPEHSDSLHLLGVLALQTGHLEAALALIERSLKLRPDGAVYWNNLGQVLERLQRDDEALRAYETAAGLDPGYAEALNNAGHLLESRGQTEAAESHYRKSLELDPNYAAPQINLGNVLKDRGELDAALAAYRRAIELRPDMSLLHSNLLLTIHYHMGYSAADIAREHATWAARHVAPLAALRRPHENVPDPARRLRIGYVSPDYREHPVARFMLPLLVKHDPRRFEIFAYADVTRPDAVTDQIRAHVDHWRDVALQSDAELAAAVRNDRIDILVDLAAHSGRNRLLVFARKPAPVQVTYLAYCSTTGVDAIDYRLTDRFLDPPGEESGPYTEHSIRLPNCYWCYSAPPLPDDRLPPSDRLGGPPTFGCLNNFAKLTDETLALWTALLQRVADARLLVYAPAEAHRDRMRSAMVGAGIAAERLGFVGRQTFADYLETYRRIDVALDPIPFGGGTTTCDALWMGTPVVTLAGRRPVSRAGTTLLSNIGLERLVARNEAEYVDIAADLMGNQDELATLRRGLRERMESSPVMDAERFARDLEDAFAGMWRTWCRQQTQSLSELELQTNEGIDNGG